MLQDLVPISRSLITMDILPERLKWSQAENIMSLETGRTFFARERATQRPVVGTAVGPHLLFTTITCMPYTIAWNGSDSNDWRVESPEWCTESAPVDMKSTVDLDFIDQRYIEAMFESPVELFVKGTLVRARLTKGFELKLRAITRTADELAWAYQKRDFRHLPGLQAAYDDWRLQKHTETLWRHEALLKQTETQLQVVLLLELFCRDPTVEKQLDAHFDRLLLWQALADTRHDAVVDFCSQVIWPFFRQNCREKATQLLMRARGKSEKKANPEESLAVETQNRELASKSVSILARARSIRFKTDASEPQPQDTPPQRLQTINAAAATAKSSLRATFLREVHMSFKGEPKGSKPAGTTSSQASSQAPPQARTTKIEPNPKRARQSRTIHVFATPAAKRKVELPKVDIELPDFDVVSTDEDE